MKRECVQVEEDGGGRAGAQARRKTTTSRSLGRRGRGGRVGGGWGENEQAKRGVFIWHWLSSKILKHSIAAHGNAISLAGAHELSWLTGFDHGGEANQELNSRRVPQHLVPDLVCNCCRTSPTVMPFGWTW